MKSFIFHFLYYIYLEIKSRAILFCLWNFTVHFHSNLFISISCMILFTISFSHAEILRFGFKYSISFFMDVFMSVYQNIGLLVIPNIIKGYLSYSHSNNFFYSYMLRYLIYLLLLFHEEISYWDKVEWIEIVLLHEVSEFLWNVCVSHIV